jgi:hypothetical protein
MTNDTTELADRMARVQAAQERKAHINRLSDRRNICMVLALVSFVVAVLLSFGHWFAKIVLPAGVISWLGPGLTTFLVLGGLAVQMKINHERTTDEIRDARPADSEVLGEMVAELQVNRELIQNLREAVAANEKQRQSDLDMVRDLSRKMFEGVHERLDRLEEGTHRLAQGSFVAGFSAALESMRPLLQEEIEKARADGYRAAFDAMVADPEELAAAGVVDIEDARMLKRLDQKVRGAKIESES